LQDKKTVHRKMRRTISEFSEQIKKGIMETQHHVNEPIKPTAAGQQGGQQGGGEQFSASVATLNQES
jgi:hypothetical protein